MPKVSIEKLVHGGQGLATLPDGKKVFVWNALPGETVEVELRKSKKSYAEAIATEIIVVSPVRLAPKDISYLATSPWQIMPIEYENDQKVLIVRELFDRENLELPDFSIRSAGPDYNYRNKMEYSFYGDDNGLHLALFNRGTHQKQIIEGSSLALPAIDKAANALVAELNRHKIRAGDLKSVIVRTDQAGKAVAALFVKSESIVPLLLPAELRGLRIYYSNPKSPASVPTKLLKTYGDDMLADNLLGTTLAYDVTGFFQVNLPVFETALQDIKRLTDDETNKLDMYSGVGSIGLPIGGTKMLIEIDPVNAEQARQNANGSAEVVQASSEASIDYVLPETCLIVDPPRAGLHEKLRSRICAIKPKRIVYLSCNPATHARDLKQILESGYKLDFFSAYNFFPHTPHIETLAALTRE